MNTLLILPIVLPLATGALLLLLARRSIVLRRTVSTVATVGYFLLTLMLFQLAADGEVRAYLIGDWPAPFGIVLALDRLSALMLLLTGLLALLVLGYAIQTTDRRGPAFHALFQFQLLGLSGAFLTADLFNLFVFFEILLIASYGLLLHGGGPERTRAGLHYVVLNLVGSSLFLIGAGLLYGAAGTLNLADLAGRIPQLTSGQIPTAASGGLLLLVVFGLKAAVLPLHFWLPRAYAATSAGVAALFAIMTKVGVYAIVRVFGTVFGPEAGTLADLVQPWLLPAGLLTVALGTLGVLTSGELRETTGYLVIVSVGTLLTGVALGNAEGMAGALYYLIHTTLVTAGLFLLADAVAAGRREGVRLVIGERPAGGRWLGSLFLLAAVALVGMPPLSGLVGKLLILTAAGGTPLVNWIWATILVSSLLILAGLSRAGILLFWRGEPSARPAPKLLHTLPAAILIGASPLLVIFGGPVTGFATAAAEQLGSNAAYVEAILGARPTSSAVPVEAS